MDAKYFHYFTDVGAMQIAKVANIAIMEDKAFAHSEQLRMQADAEQQFQVYEQRIRQLTEQLTIAINALEFYDETPNTINQNLYDADSGQRARYTLLEIKKLEGK